MAYFLKKSNLKKGLYLQIYESFYDPVKKNTSHKSFRPIGYVDDLIHSGISDPIAYFSDEVKQLNAELKNKKAAEKQKLIDDSPTRYLGYFPIKNILNGLAVSNHIDLLQFNRSFPFSINEIMEAFIYSRCVKPRDKFASFHDVIPHLYGLNLDYSDDQLLSALAIMGEEYEKIIEIFTNRISSHYGFSTSTSTSYLYKTNFYFEIDKQNSPIVEIGLLLDAHLLPIGMRLYPGNLSEKSKFESMMDFLKQQNTITGKTIQVADKDLNCAANIYAAKEKQDGYIFSKSIKSLSEAELKWVMSEDNIYTPVYDENNELNYKYTSTVDSFKYEFTDSDGKKKRFIVKEKRILTFHPSLCEEDRFKMKKLLEKAKKRIACQADRNEYGEESTYVTFSTTDTNEKLIVEINTDKFEKDYALAGYHMFVTSEISMDNKEAYYIYQNLWTIEQFFRIMKSELDICPVFCKSENTIKAHFLICYLSTLLTKILECKVLKNKIDSSQLYDFLHSFVVLEESQDKYINVSSPSPAMTALAETFDLPLRNFYLSSNQIKKMLNQVI